MRYQLCVDRRGEFQQGQHPLLQGRQGGEMLLDAPSWMRHVHSESSTALSWLDPDGSNAQIPYELALLRRGYG